MYIALCKLPMKSGQQVFSFLRNTLFKSYLPIYFLKQGIYKKWGHIECYSVISMRDPIYGMHTSERIHHTFQPWKVEKHEIDIK